MNMKKLYYPLLVFLTLLAAFPLEGSERDSVRVSVPWQGTEGAARTTVSARNICSGPLEKSPFVDIWGRMTGLIPGLEITRGGGTMSTVAASKGIASSICFIDDIPVPMELVYLDPNQIESITYLSDAVDKALYGPRATYGAFYIRTKGGGWEQPFTVHASVESGIDFVNWMGGYVGGVEYARLNNQARAAAGYTQLYSEQAIAGFAQGNPYDRRYPNVDWNSFFLRGWKPLSRVGLDVSGGTRNIKYHLALNGLHDGDLIKVGPPMDYNKINLTSRITARIDRYITAGATFMGLLAYNRSSRGNIFSANSVIPVAFPIALGISQGQTDIDGDKAGTTIYAVSRSFPANPYALIIDGGFTMTRLRSGLFSADLDIDLGWLLKGLSARGAVSFLSNYTLQSGKTNDYLAYYWDPAGDIVDLSTHQGVKASAKSLLGTSTYQDFSTYAQLKYVLERGGHALRLSGTGYLSSTSRSASSYYERYVTAIGAAAYNYRERYLADLTVNYSGSTQYAREGRWRAFPALGLAWVVSKEPWMEGVSWLEDLRLTAKGGLLGEYWPTGSNFLYEGTYTSGSADTYGPAPNGQWFGSDTQSVPVTTITRLANRDLTWPVIREVDLGFTLGLCCGLELEAKWFSLRRMNLISNTMDRFNPSYGWNGIVWYDNSTETLTRGVEGALRYHRRSGEVDWSVGTTFASWDAWYTKLVRDDSLYPWQKQTGRSTGAYVALECIGKFETPEQIATRPKYDQTGTRVGDLMYKDLNDDGMIDANDQKEVGNTTPRLRLSPTADIRWRIWELNLVGVGQFGYDAALAGAYFRGGSGDGNYSVFIRDNIGGAYPRLSYLASATNALNSTFWLRHVSWLKLRSVELACNLPVREGAPVKGVRLSLKGSNLLTLTNLKEMDPEFPSAGISSYPFYKGVMLGAKLTF